MRGEPFDLTNKLLEEAASPNLVHERIHGCLSAASGSQAIGGEPGAYRCSRPHDVHRSAYTPRRGRPRSLTPPQKLFTGAPAIHVPG